MYVYFRKHKIYPVNVLYSKWYYYLEKKIGGTYVIPAHVKYFKKFYQDAEFRGNIVSYDNANVQKVKF